MRNLLRRFVPFLIWFVIGFIFTTQLRLLTSRTGTTMSWRDAFLWEVPRWLLWTLIAPFVSAVAKRYPWRKDQKARFIAVHTMSALVVSAFHLFLFVLIFHLLRLSMAPQGNFLTTLKFAFPLDFHVGVAVYFLVVLLTQYSESQQRISRLQAELTNAQLKALKMQLHPHFLFNTLNSISSYLRTDVEVADEMIGRLGDFLRLTLQNPSAQEVPLETEIEFLKQYLSIEQLRFQDRLRTEFAIAANTAHALVPNLILQPVAENAVRYAVAPKREPTRIRITSNVIDGDLQIRVEDNGPGLPPQMQEGIGLNTTRERLEQLYGKQALLKLNNHPEGGTIVTVTLPFRIAEKKS